MKKLVAIFALVYASSMFAGTSLYAPWYYDTDGCAKIYPYGSDSSSVGAVVYGAPFGIVEARQVLVVGQESE